MARRRILLAVTIDDSLQFIRGFPDFLVENGWDVHVVSSPGPRLEELSTHAHIFTHPLPMAREPSLAADLVSLAKWIKLVRAVRPEVTSVGTPKAGLLGGIAALVNGVPRRIYLLRGLRLETTQGLKRALLVVLERVAVGSSHHVISVSASLRDRAIALGIAKPSKIQVLGSGSSNGVDADTFTPAHDAAQVEALRGELGLVPGLPTLGFVGRLTADKGLESLAAARRILAARSVDHQLLIVGGIDDHASPTVIDEVVATGRPAVVTGRVADTSPYYHLMDVFCLPTLREGFPNVVLEASASGVAVVTTDATGASDSVVPEVTGLIADALAPDELADQIERLIRDPSLRRKLGEAGRQWVFENFNRQAVWRSTEAFYGASDV